MSRHVLIGDRRRHGAHQKLARLSTNCAECSQLEARLPIYRLRDLSSEGRTIVCAAGDLTCRSADALGAQLEGSRTDVKSNNANSGSPNHLSRNRSHGRSRAPCRTLPRILDPRTRCHRQSQDRLRWPLTHRPGLLDILIEKRQCLRYAALARRPRKHRQAPCAVWLTLNAHVTNPSGYRGFSGIEEPLSATNEIVFAGGRS